MDELNVDVLYTILSNIKQPTFFQLTCKNVCCLKKIKNMNKRNLRLNFRYKEFGVKNEIIERENRLFTIFAYDYGMVDCFRKRLFYNLDCINDYDRCFIGIDTKKHSYEDYLQLTDDMIRLAVATIDEHFLVNNIHYWYDMSLTPYHKDGILKGCTGYSSRQTMCDQYLHTVVTLDYNIDEEDYYYRTFLAMGVKKMIICLCIEIDEEENCLEYFTNIQDPTDSGFLEELRNEYEETTIIVIPYNDEKDYNVTETSNKYDWWDGPTIEECFI